MPDGQDRSPGAPEIAVGELARRLTGAAPPVLVDVREPYERAVSFIAGSLHVPLDQLEARARELFPDAGASIVLYCATGIRSLYGVERLSRLGYRHALSLAGGIVEWEFRGHAVTGGEAPARREWSPRYSRQLRIPEVGPDGQKRLLEARVLVIGAGGLGSPAALYLAAAGVGTLGIVDFDNVDITNLHRQILFATGDVGAPKAQTASARLAALNPEIEIVAHPERLTAANAEAIVSDYEVVVDGSDNFATRYLVNDVCLKLGRPDVHGSIMRFEGQVSVFCAARGPCYRCLFPEPPPPGVVPSCAEAGVLGLLPGVIGTLQATETVKLLLGIGESLVGRLVRYDALAMRFDEFRIDRADDCAWCRPGATFPGLVDYDSFCGPG